MKPINMSFFDFPTLLAKGCVSLGRRVRCVGVNYNPAATVRTVDDVKCEWA